MANLKQLRKRIHSISSIQKITKAMQLVSATKMTKAQNVFKMQLPVLDAVCKILQNLTTISEKIGFKKNDNSHVLVLITSNKGLCGSYNSSIIKTFKGMLTEFESQNIAPSIIFIGKKANEIFKSKFSNNPNVVFYDNVDYLVYPDFAENISQKIIEFLFKNAGSVKICFNNYKNTITYTNTIKSIWPIQKQSQSDTYELEEIDFMSVVKLYFKICILNALLASNSSELSARMVSMDNATRNAKSLIEKLTLNLNRSRQAIVTKELIEIISGAEAL